MQEAQGATYNLDDKRPLGQRKGYLCTAAPRIACRPTAVLFLQQHRGVPPVPPRARSPRADAGLELNSPFVSDI